MGKSLGESEVKADPFARGHGGLGGTLAVQSDQLGSVAGRTWTEKVSVEAEALRCPTDTFCSASQVFTINMKREHCFFHSKVG